MGVIYAQIGFRNKREALRTVDPTEICGCVYAYPRFVAILCKAHDDGSYAIWWIHVSLPGTYSWPAFVVTFKCMRISNQGVQAAL